MEKEHKYYTPSIEEFHIGFKFEIKPFENEDWIENTLQCINELQFIKDGLPIRVKCLDKDDIENEGFELIYTDPIIYKLVNTLVFKLNNYKVVLYDSEVINKHFTYNKCNLCITEEENKLSLFIGNIKNLSEFKKLLQQLNIK